MASVLKSCGYEQSILEPCLFYQHDLLLVVYVDDILITGKNDEVINKTKQLLQQKFVMKDLVAKAGLSDQFEIASAATSTEEIGNPVYPPARRKLAEHGISCEGKTARQMTRRDYETYDYLIAMDHNNLRNMARFVGGDPEHKVSLLMDHTRRPGDVADPWYTGDFEATWQDVLEGCTALLEELR